jgi:transmembrane sensor
VSEDRKGSLLFTSRWDEALAWHATLRDAKEEELTLALGREWQNWYANADNRRIFDAMARLLADRGTFQMLRRPASAELDSDEYDGSVSIAEWRKAQGLKGKGRRQPPAGSSWKGFSGGVALAASLAIIALAGAWLLRLRAGTGPSRPAIYQTAIGGIEDVRLPDGSSIVLGGSSKLSVSYSAQRRSVTLTDGQAWFKVVHNPRWPFVVAAGDGTITAVGTAFLVTRNSDRVVVTVTEGTVEVATETRRQRPSGMAERVSLASISVSRGEQLALRDDGAFGPIKPADLRAATDWTRGRLIFDDQPLRYVIETVNRYSSRHIVLSRAAGALRFSGIVFDNEIDDWLQSLKIIFPVTVEAHGADVRIQMRGSKPKAPESPNNTAR